MARKKKSENTVAQEAVTTTTQSEGTNAVTPEMPAAAAPVVTRAATQEAKPEKAPRKELTAKEKLAERIKAGDDLLVVVNHEDLHMLYPHADTPANREKALRLCRSNSGGKPLTFLNDKVTKA